MNFWKNSNRPLTPPHFRKIRLQFFWKTSKKVLYNCPKSAACIFLLKLTHPFPPFGSFQKFIRFGSLTRPLLLNLFLILKAVLLKVCLDRLMSFNRADLRPLFNQVRVRTDGSASHPPTVLDSCKSKPGWTPCRQPLRRGSGLLRS